MCWSPAQVNPPEGEAAASAVTTTGGPEASVGATTMSDRPATVRVQARSRPSGEKRGPDSPRDRATMAGVTVDAAPSPSMEGGRYRRSAVVSPSPTTTKEDTGAMRKAQELPDRNLGMELVRVTEAAAMAGAR